MSLVGNLEDLGLGEILQIVSLSRKTGILSLHSRGREGSIVFRQGQVVRATSSIWQQSLGEVLIQKGVIDLAILRKALAVQQQEGFRERLGVILINKYGVAQDVVEEVVREQIENVIFSLFTWSDGTFDFSARDSVETVDGTHLDPLQFMLVQGLNPQILALEGARILDERRNSEEEADNVAPAAIEPEQQAVGRRPLSAVALPSTPVASATPRQLVIVDDDGPTLQTLAGKLESLGFVVHAMTRSEDTLIKVDTLFRSGDAPLVLVDLIMPKMDGSGVLGGIELLELLHSNFKDMNFVVMSDYSHAEAEKKVRDLGCPFLMKPRRAEIGMPDKVDAFLKQLRQELRRAETGEALPDSPEKINLGDELRLEMGDDDDMPLPAASGDSVGGLTLLRGMLEELNNPELQGGVLLLVLRFASEFLNRAIVFTVDNNMVTGMGQFGVGSGKTGGDARVRSVHIPLESPSMFRDVCRNERAMTFAAPFRPQDDHLFELLGDGVPEESFIGPLISQSRVIGFLYGDNLPEQRAIGETESLEIFLSQAGLAMEKCLLEQQLHERSHQ